MFDFASIGRSEGERAGVNDKGLVTGDRQIRKDAFYSYQAQWTTNPMVHITSRRFNPHPVGPTSLKVYSNCDRVELFLNCKSLGSKASADHVFVWQDAELLAGENKIEARAVLRGRTVTDSISWKCSPDASPHLRPVDSPAPKERPSDSAMREFIRSPAFVGLISLAAQAEALRAAAKSNPAAAAEPAKRKRRK